MEIILIKKLPDNVLYLSLNHLSEEVENKFLLFQRRPKIRNFNKTLRKMKLLNLVIAELRFRNLEFKIPLIVREIFHSFQI